MPFFFFSFFDDCTVSSAVHIQNVPNLKQLTASAVPHPPPERSAGLGGLALVSNERFCLAGI